MAIILQPMTQEDITFSYQLSQQIGWPHRRRDWQQAFELGNGFVAFVKGKRVGCALFWCWGSVSSSIGLVIVDPIYQGKGIGKLLISALIDKLQGNTIRLYATEMGKELYRQFGFIAQGCLSQHQNPSLGEITAIPFASDQHYRKAVWQDIPKLVEHDYQAHGLWRPALWQQLYQEAEALDILQQGEQICGIAVRRRFGRGYLIGPLLAANLHDAKRLFSASANSVTGKFVRIDSYADSDFAKWLTEVGLTVVDRPLIMIRGEIKKNAGAALQYFALASQALA